jgi:glycosyltransferase involved in cell wall biosynthesis
MKVFVAHNRYRSDVPSGENMVVDAEIELLRAVGVDVVPVLAASDQISLRSPRGLAGAAMGPVYAPRAVPQFRAMLERERPDVVHLHNVYPLLSPWVVRVAHEQRVPVVQTIHNFRHDCVSGSYFRDGAICTDCAGTRLATPAVRHGCYRGSRLQSVPMVVGRAAHRSTWRSVDRFLALTPFHAEFLTGALGVDPGNVMVRPTSAPDPGREAVHPAPTTDVVFVGRLDEQKGVRLLLDAWRARRPSQARLQIVGDGPLRAAVDAAAAADPSITVHGLLAPADVAAQMRSAGVLVIPSVSYEGLPRALVEAYAAGRAAAVSDLGGLATSVPDAVGWRFPPTVAGLVATLDSIDATMVRDKGAAARETYESTYSPTVTTQQLLDVYADLAGSRA